MAGGVLPNETRESPMPVVFHAAAAGAADGLIVLLPGFSDGPASFDNQGMDKTKQ